MVGDAPSRPQAFWPVGKMLRSAVAAAIFCLSALLPASAQNSAVLQNGDAAVTGFSGSAQLVPPAGRNADDFKIINGQGASLQVFDLSRMNGPDDGRLVFAARRFMATADQIGQVFGVTIDDGFTPGQSDRAPNIYATATSVFGLNLVVTQNGDRTRTKTGGADRAWMNGQFGSAQGGGPGSIWKIDGRSGEVSLFANVMLNGMENDAAGLGNITFDPRTRLLFVSDMQTGMIHAYGLDGAERAVFDHGTKARPLAGLGAIELDPLRRTGITSPNFDTNVSDTWGYADQGRRVWGLAVRGERLYYAVAEGPEIWSVGIAENGLFKVDAQLEIQLSANSADPVSKIVFDGNGTMYLSQRGAPTPAYDFAVLAKPDTASVLRYKQRQLSNGSRIWHPLADEYAVGFEQGYRKSNGGIALGFGYDQSGNLRQSACQSTLWSTGESLRLDDAQKDRLLGGGAMVVNGLQGNAVNLYRPANEGPFQSYFVDFDATHLDPDATGHMGDIVIWAQCPPAGAAQPTPPAGPRLSVEKTCSAAMSGSQMACRVAVANSGSAAPSGAVSITDITDALVGPRPPMVINVTAGQGWACSALPATDMTCSIAGNLLQPGQTRSFDVVMDVSAVMNTAGWKVRNCAIIDGTRQSACVTKGEYDTLYVSKSGPKQGVCVVGGPCDFELTVHNPGQSAFDGTLTFADDLSIGGVSASGIRIDGIWPAHGCKIAGGGLPAQWECYMSVPARGFKSFNIDLTLPQNSVGQGVRTGRNCFAATTPVLANSGNALHANVGQQPFAQGAAAYTPSRDCVNFEIWPGTPTGRPKTLPFGPKLQITSVAAPRVFSTAGQTLTVVYTVSNTGTDPVLNFRLTDNKVRNIVCQQADALAPGASAKCTGTYTTTPADVGQYISTTAALVATSKSGPVKPPATATTIVLFHPPGASQPLPGPASGTGQVPGGTTNPSLPARNPQTGQTGQTGGTGQSAGTGGTPASGTGAAPVTNGLTMEITASVKSFDKTLLPITYDYVIRNTGTAPITGFSLKSSRFAKLQCPPNTLSGGSPATFVGTLAPGASVTCKAFYTTSQFDLGKSLNDQMSAYFTVAGSNAPRAAVGSLEIPFEVRPSIHLSGGPAPKTFSYVGERLHYQYLVTNTGGTELEAFAVTDKVATNIVCLPGTDNFGGPIKPGASVLCNGEYFVKASDFGKPITNDAMVRAGARNNLDPDKIVEHKGVGGSVAFEPKPKLTISVTPDTQNIYKAYQKVYLTYTVNNVGSAPLESFNITDARLGKPFCGPVANGGRLEAGRTTLCKAIYLTSKGDIDARKVTWEYAVQGVATGAPAVTVTDKMMLTTGATPKFTCGSEYVSYTSATHPDGGYCVLLAVRDEHDRCVKTNAELIAKNPQYADTCRSLGHGVSGMPPSACPDDEPDCKTAEQNCGELQPKRLFVHSQTHKWELRQSHPYNPDIAFPGAAPYEPWYTGCRGGTAFARSHGQAIAQSVCDSDPSVCYGREARRCDMFCAKNLARQACDFDNNPLMVDEIPASDATPIDPRTGALAAELYVCPWRITDTMALGGAPVALEPLKLPPIQISDVCWKPGGKGVCPPGQGYTDAGLQCVKGGTLEAAMVVTSQVISAVTAVVAVVPGANTVVKGITEGAKKLGGMVGDAVSAVGNFFKRTFGGSSRAKRELGDEALNLAKNKSRLDMIRSYAKASDAHQAAKTDWAGRIMSVRKDVGMAMRTRRLIERLEKRQEDADQKRKLLNTGHSILDVLSFVPGPTGAVADVLNNFGHPECRF